MATDAEPMGSIRNVWASRFPDCTGMNWKGEKYILAYGFLFCKIMTKRMGRSRLLPCICESRELS